MACRALSGDRDVQRRGAGDGELGAPYHIAGLREARAGKAGQVGAGGGPAALDGFPGQRGSGAGMLIERRGQPGGGVRAVAGGDAGAEALLLGEGGEDIDREVLGEPQRPHQQG
jgi:hypothetical protein